MTRIFDGMAGALAGVFGAPVPYRSKYGPASTIQSVFRETPIEVLDESGRATLIVAPTWKVPLNLADGIARGDEIEPSPGRIFRILNRLNSANPARDRFVMFELEDLGD